MEDKNLCPYCKQRVSFWKKINIDPRYTVKCPHCKKKISVPRWTKLPPYLIMVSFYFINREWVMSNRILSLVMLGVFIVFYSVIEGIFLPLKGREEE